MAINSITSDKLDAFFRSALEKYVVDNEVLVFTDIYLQLKMEVPLQK